ncbi:Leptomycin B resistance protein pmd1 [Pyrenophora tritici-repentis]|uniref:Leptomycin B resistance protein pmd1 n=1 Tax=Pyrenophora tritici-repentis TaxID=45151 RepID=A0A2W1EAB3_9PLEO|nr:Leptomycin B resistance protein pmd1 [Pyrenophora tritici-repentis]KAG9386764.1 Leptomycin B resistance protein pmd1 [Pyrenophora tritici-repentis]KAI0581578.1 Leptomycin B resistance protein pmd1 [Pyrenophora tritici-repentis]KAI0587700.1 Leptomycin B resistance protein pmd1 [Pyrenophora tritici-repentis]KAI0609229.1 Leptomycin B resistance protein pmd1 [Pyrenophora tritici-repentis]
MDNEDSATSTGTAISAAVEKHESQSERESRPPTSPLSDQEKDIIDRQLTAPNLTVGYFSLFRYASTKDKLIMVLALFASIAAGAVMPLMTLVYGNFAGSFTSFSVDATAAAKFEQQINKFTLYFIYLGIGAFVTSYVSILGFSYTGERITRVIRELYLRAIFRQNIAFFDFLGSGEITTRISSDMNLVQDGIGQKIGLFVTGVSMFVSALIIGFIRSWKLSLIMLAATVALILMMGVNGTLMKKAQTLSIDEYATAASLAEEVLSSARNVAAYGTQKRLEEKYKAFVDRASQFDFKAKFWLSMMIAGMMGVLNLQYALAFWQGKRFLDAGELGVSNILTVIMALMIAGFSIGQNLPHIQAFGAATAAATKVFNTIERNSPIDPETETGIVPDDFVGNLEFKNLKHVYPSRPDTVVLSDFNLSVPSGKMVALVGASGSGKSTIVGLLERFYLPMEGEIHLDGRDITTLNLRWLRQHMAIVSQEPVLFSTTIYESILHGLVNTEYANVSDEKKMELIEKAAKIANAHDFIMDLPEKYQTKVGERGGLLSGGQKQRVAIARAIVSDPKILLLDEATAALDTRAESAVQEALDRASQGRTTIVIAHRLSTIKKADKIVVMALGRIVEQGTHQELINTNGVYASLVQAQELTSKINPVNRESSLEVAEKPAIGETDVEKLALMRTTTSAPTEFLNRKDEKEKEYGTWELIKFAWEMNSGEQLSMTIGLLASFFAGCNPAIQAIFLANSINSLLSPGTSLGGLGISFWCWMFLMLGLLIGFFYYIQGITLSKGSAKLVGSVRQRAFGAMLRQDMEFFDGDTVTSGALSNFLSSEANRLAGLSGSTLGTIVSAASSVLVAFIVGCSFGWKLALVCSATIPLVIACGYFRYHALTRMEKRTKETSDSASFACEAASSIRTVASLSLEKHLLSEYHDKLADQGKGYFKFTNVSSVLYATSQGLSMFIFALVFWYGGRLLFKQEYTVLQFFVVYSGIINGAQAAGSIFSFAPDMGEARDAAKLLKSFMNRVPKIDHWSPEGKKVDRLDGRIELQGVRFSYPGRPDHRVLRGVSLSAQPGQFIALVGASGSGKSTVMQMLERFYDPTSGSVLVDGVELKDYNLQDYRSQLAIVSQETTLYTGTIRENILANQDGLGDDVVIQACKNANIYEFITSLPDGFNTLVGAKGALLSGGQRQRIAIARALLRDPKVLLLDEATSALDSTSERVVQAALDSASKGRTTVAIAHRLSTIQHADVIYVFDQGKIVEQGTHEDLVAKKGVYFELARLQAIGAPQ